MIKHFSNNKQFGIALIGMMAVLVLIATTITIQFFNRSNLIELKNKKTHQVLVEAKHALLAFSTQTISKTFNQVPLDCGASTTNCPRPGELPCPDTDNDGISDGPCNTQVKRLGRLPWKTLGLNDLRDGSGEHLWYALSNNYKSSPRDLPINSNNFGSISLTNSQGDLINDATNQNGLVALLIAPNDPLLRADNHQQNRANTNNAIEYLDLGLNVDNASFAENTLDGFIAGPIKQNGTIIVNDIMLPITRTQINHVMESRVLAEVVEALLASYCNNNQSMALRTCNSPTTGSHFPSPANITDTSCIAINTITLGNCSADESVLIGRIPTSETDTTVTPASHTALWSSGNPNSILQGNMNNNWFQLNGWRELIFYSVAPACNAGTLNCSGSGFLTLNNATSPKSSPSQLNKQVVVISSGSMLTGQIRANNTDQSNLNNYLEDENITLPNDVFARLSENQTRNDKVISIP